MVTLRVVGGCDLEVYGDFGTFSHVLTIFPTIAIVMSPLKHLESYYPVPPLCLITSVVNIVYEEI
jgi:hypothetical protein